MSSELPYFRWHPKDFDTDEHVRLMDLEEIGLFILCLNHAWVNGSIPDDVQKLAKLFHKPTKKILRAWVNVSKCFIKNDTDQLVNPKQERERVWARGRKDKCKQAAEMRHSMPVDTAPLNTVQSSGEGKAKDALLRVRASASDSDSVCSSSVSVEGGLGETTELPPVDTETMLRRWQQHKNFKKPCKPERERAAVKWPSFEMDEENLTLALDGYHASDWAKQNGYPFFGFLKDPWSWIKRSNAVSIPQFDTVQDYLRVTVITPSLRQYFSLFLAGGRELSVTEMEAVRIEWETLNEHKQAGAISHAERNFPLRRFLPSPKNHLAGQPWTAIAVERQMPIPASANNGLDRHKNTGDILDGMCPETRVEQNSNGHHHGEIL